jgi:hypothetical protein
MRPARPPSLASWPIRVLVAGLAASPRSGIGSAPRTGWLAEGGGERNPVRGFLAASDAAVLDDGGMHVLPSEGSCRDCAQHRCCTAGTTRLAAGALLLGAARDAREPRIFESRGRTHRRLQWLSARRVMIVSCNR